MPFRLLRSMLGLLRPLLVPVGVALGFAGLLPLHAAVPAFLATMAALVLAGCTIVRTTAVQQLTWRHRAAGLCLPFAQVMGGGTLPRVAVSSLLGSAIVGAVVFLLVELGRHGAAPPWYVLAAWALNWTSMMFLVATRTRSYTWGAPGARRGARLLVLVVAQFAASVALHLADRSAAAALVACLPQLAVVGSTVLLMTAMVLRGRRMRWN